MKTGSGNRIHNDYAKFWRKARRARGCQTSDRTPCVRHTFGTRCLQAGGDSYKLSKIMGHASVAATEVHYAHLLKEDLIAASRLVKLPIANRSNSNVVPISRRRAKDRGTS